MRSVFIFLFISLLTVACTGCGGPAVTKAKVLSSSVPKTPEMENLKAQSGLNVQVLSKIPEKKFSVIKIYKSYYEYDKGSVTFKKIEKKKHLAQLRVEAGEMGANAIIVKPLGSMPEGGVATREVMTGGGSAQMGAPRQGNTTGVMQETRVQLVNSDKKTIEEVEVYAIYVH